MKQGEIVQGDCREILKDLPDGFCDCAFTSPPYNRTVGDKYAEYNDRQSDYLQFLIDVTDQLLRIAKDKVIVNIQQTYHNKIEVFKYIGHYAEKLAGVVVWTKKNPQPGNNYDGETRSITNAFEYFFVFSKDGRFRSYGEKQTLNHIETGVNPEHFEGHGAVMNYKIARWFIERFTKPNDFVIDPFMGMGTTALACESLGRTWGGCELSPKYIQMAYKRLEEVQIEFDI